jgi:hypothetical protein
MGVRTRNLDMIGAISRDAADRAKREAVGFVARPTSPGRQLGFATKGSARSHDSAATCQCQEN